jgi:hypothetical protein
MKFSPRMHISVNDPNYRNVILEHFEGTYKSNWYFLLQATRSSLIQAANNTSKLIDVYERARSRKQNHAETLVVLNLNYSTYLAGPLLGTILFACAALEACFRMIMRAVLEQKVGKKERAKGTSVGVVKKLGEFDALSAIPKLTAIYQTLTGRRVPSAVLEEFKQLVHFRNNCFHGDPVVILSRGLDQTTKQYKSLAPRAGNYYPFLWDGNRPLSLSHGLRAIRVHDCIVHDLLLNRAAEFHTFSDLHDISAKNNLIEAKLPKALSTEKLDQLASAWRKLEEALNLVPAEEVRPLLIELNRRTTMRPVK